MAENLADKLKLAWAVFEDDGAGSMPELMDGHFQACCLVDALCDLHTEGNLALGAITQTGNK